MSNADRDEGGQYTRKVTDKEIIESLRESDTPVMTAGELADTLPIGRRAVRKRLHDLNEREQVGRKDVGARAVVWWLTEKPGVGDAETAADRLGGFGMLGGEEGEQFKAGVARARGELNDGFEEREDALFGE